MNFRYRRYLRRVNPIYTAPDLRSNTIIWTNQGILPAPESESCNKITLIPQFASSLPMEFQSSVTYILSWLQI